jgi:glycosyltransferase involved in cell wall biosynthesis
MTPLVSVVMPVRNASRWLGEAIDSVVRQTLSDLELLVIDDGSTDETPQILSDWLCRDGRIRLLRQQDLGLVAALNYGLAEARGPFLARLDADDCAAPERLERQIRVLDNDPSIGLLGSWAQRIDEHGRPRGNLKPKTDPEQLVDILAYANPFIHSTIMLRTEIARGLGGYRTAFEAAEDYDLWLRMSEVTRLANVAEPLVQYRRHGANVTTRKVIRQSFSVRLAQRAAWIRRQTGCDPATDLASAPDWRLPQALSSFYAEDVVTYRLFDFADSDFANRNREADFSPLVERLSQLNHAERGLAALAMINHLRHAPAAAASRTLRVFAQLIWQRPRMALLAARCLHSRSGLALHGTSRDLTHMAAGKDTGDS